MSKKNSSFVFLLLAFEVATVIGADQQGALMPTVLPLIRLALRIISTPFLVLMIGHSG